MTDSGSRELDILYLNLNLYPNLPANECSQGSLNPS